MINLPDPETIWEWDAHLMMAIEYFRSSEKIIHATELQMALDDLSGLSDACKSVSEGNRAQLYLKSLAFISLEAREIAFKGE